MGDFIILCMLEQMYYINREVNVRTFGWWIVWQPLCRIGLQKNLQIKLWNFGVVASETLDL